MKRFYSILILISTFIIILILSFIVEFKIQETFMSSQNILVIGDSHTQVFKYCNDKNTDYHFDVQKVSGATAQGSVNPNSKTNALKI